MMRTGLSRRFARIRALAADHHADDHGGDDHGDHREDLVELQRDRLVGTHEVLHRQPDDQRHGDQREQAVDGGQRDVERDVALREVREQVRGGATWGGGQQHQADGELGGEGEQMGDPEADRREDQHLRDEPDDHRAWVNDDPLEIGELQAEAEAEHDDAECDRQKHRGDDIPLHARTFDKPCR